MIETLFVASVVATLGALLYLRLREPTAPRQALFRGLLELTVPLMLTSGLFAALQWWARSAENSVTAATTIREIERAIRLIRNRYIEPLVMPAWVQFFLLIMIVLIGTIRPNVGRAGARGLKTGTRWMTRVQIAATLLASFTFFGSVQATNARHAEVRLGEEIGRIERAYDHAFASADEVLARAATAELLSAPNWKAALNHLADALEDQQSTTSEIASARTTITDQPFSNLRKFHLAMENFPSAVDKVNFLQRERTTTLPQRETWTRSEADALASDAATLRRETITDIVNAAADTGREALAKRLVAEYFAGSAAEGFAAVVLDASVFYDFRHIVAQASASLVERVLGRRERLKTAFAAVLPEIREAAGRLAPNAAAAAQEIYVERSKASRELLTNAQRVRRDTLQEYRIAANEQAEREQKTLIERVTKGLDFELELAAKPLLQRLIGSGEPSMARIARIRALEHDFRIPSWTVSLLVHKERELGGATLFGDLVEWRVDRLLMTERYSTPAFFTTDLLDGEVRELWEKQKREFAMAKISEGVTRIEPHHWDSMRMHFRSLPQVRRVVETRERAIKERANRARRRGK